MLTQNGKATLGAKAVKRNAVRNIPGRTGPNGVEMDRAKPPDQLGVKRPQVQVLSLGPTNDNPNYIIQVGSVFGFIISIENVL